MVLVAAVRKAESYWRRCKEKIEATVGHCYIGWTSKYVDRVLYGEGCNMKQCAVGLC